MNLNNIRSMMTNFGDKGAFSGFSKNKSESNQATFTIQSKRVVYEGWFLVVTSIYFFLGLLFGGKVYSPVAYTTYMLPVLIYVYLLWLIKNPINRNQRLVKITAGILLVYGITGLIGGFMSLNAPNFWFSLLYTAITLDIGIFLWRTKFTR